MSFILLNNNMYNFMEDGGGREKINKYPYVQAVI
jgi:hypothetical protein